MRNGRKSNGRREAPPAIEYEVRSGNIFADVGVPNADKALVRAELARRIGLVIGERRLTQAQAAVALGIDQPMVSNLLCGVLDGFSTDRLFRFLNAPVQSVEIAVRPPAKCKAVRTRVVA